jgi:hypothetical protein
VRIAVIDNRVVVEHRNASGLRTANRSVPFQRSHASCTTSSASDALPTIRFAMCSIR